MVHPLTSYQKDFLNRSDLVKKEKKFHAVMREVGLKEYHWETGVIVEPLWKRSLRKFAYLFRPIGKDGFPSYFGKYKVAENGFLNRSGTHVVLRILMDGESYSFRPSDPTPAVLMLYEPEYRIAADQIASVITDLYGVSARVEEHFEEAPQFAFSPVD